MDVEASEAVPEITPPLPATAEAKLLSVPVASISRLLPLTTTLLPTVALVVESLEASDRIAPAARRPATTPVAEASCRVIEDAVTSALPVTVLPSPREAVVEPVKLASLSVPLIPTRPPEAPMACDWAVGSAPCAVWAVTRSMSAVTALPPATVADVVVFTAASASDTPTAASPALTPMDSASVEGVAVALTSTSS